jgi:hypothetical protein
MRYVKRQLHARPYLASEDPVFSAYQSRLTFTCPKLHVGRNIGRQPLRKEKVVAFFGEPITYGSSTLSKVSFYFIFRRFNSRSKELAR